MSRRERCSYCGQDLALSSYYRHMNDVTGDICPARYKPGETNLDSTFDFGSSSEEDTNFFDAEPVVASGGAINESDSECVENDTFSDLEEIWETSDEEADYTEEVVRNVQNIMFGLSAFLNFFQLAFRISERAMFILLKFLRHFVFYLSSIIPGNAILEQLNAHFPRSVYSIRKVLKVGYNDFTEYVVCPQCFKIYDYDKCVLKVGSQEQSLKCQYIQFPNHPQRSRREKCNTILLKKVRIGRIFKLVPRKTYVYQSILQSLTLFCSRPCFLTDCNSWRYRQDYGSMSDIYDGRVWKELHEIDGDPYLSLPNNLCLALNIDWFNPYKQTQYSAGAIYLSVLNLPRAKRFKPHNTILVGMIPGPHEPTNMNPFLEPLVTELKRLYEGIYVNVSSRMVKIRAILACITCDLPATRKTCGFSNFNGLKGCSKCIKSFPTASFGSKPDYSGFNCDSWPVRELSVHVQKAIKARDAKTATERRALERSYGCKYSVLLELPSFDIVRYHVVDPMHNLFLGLAKHTTKLWSDLGVLSHRDFIEIQDRVDSMCVPSKIRRIPRKIASNFFSFTADEWKHWILIYSVFALKNILEDEHYSCWCTFVSACRLLLKAQLTQETVEQAHSNLVLFCRQFENLYGAERYTPNMHMSCHLKDCMLDYSVLSAFWCFPFERMNGILKGMKKSWVSPEKQMFSKFINLQSLSIFTTKEHNSDFLSLLNTENVISCSDDEAGSSSVGQSQVSDEFTIEMIANQNCDVSSIIAIKQPYQVLACPLYEKSLSDVEYEILSEMYATLYPYVAIHWISRFYRETKRLVINGEEILSLQSQSDRSAMITAKWQGRNGIDVLAQEPNGVGIIRCLIHHTIRVIPQGTSEETPIPLEHVLAQVEWYESHPERNFFGESVIVVSTISHGLTRTSFMPVSRITARCAYIKTSYRFNYGYDEIMNCVPLYKSF